MFSDPQSVTLNSVATSFPRTGASLTSGRFTTADDLNVLTISHQAGRRFRRIVRLDQQQTVSDPIVPSNNIVSSMSVYMVVDHPRVGYSVAQVKYVVDGLVDWLDASSGANVTKLLGAEV